MIYFTEEGEKLKNGLNLYPLDDKHNKGGRFRIGNYVQFFRYSTFTHKIFLNRERKYDTI